MNKLLPILLFLFSATTMFAQLTNDCVGDEPFISQVAEGSSNNKVVEIANPTGSTLDMSGYVLRRYANANTSGTPIALDAIMVDDGNVFVICNGSADAAITAVADQTSGTITHNGNDHYVLEKTDGTIVDSYGDVGNSATFGADMNMKRVIPPGGAACPYDIEISDAFDPTDYSSTAYSSGLPEDLGEILPIELKTFRATASENTVTLNWETITEINNSHFNVLHSDNGREFYTVAKIAGAGTTTEAQTYSYEFTNAPVGKNYFQLEQVDFNGDSEKFNIEVVNIKGDDIRIFPSSVETTITVEGINMDSEYAIYSSIGQVVQTGVTSGSISVENLVNGTYFIKVNDTVLNFFKL